MNLFSLKFETGSYFLKSMKKCCTLGKITRVNIENLLWRHRCLITQTQGNGMQISHEE